MLKIKCQHCYRSFKTTISDPSSNELYCPYCGSRCSFEYQDSSTKNSLIDRLLDFFKITKYKRELENATADKLRLENELKQLRATFTPEMRDAEHLTNLISNYKNEIENLRAQINTLNNELVTVSSELSNKRKLVIETDETILLQEFGLYTPTYDFKNSSEYKSQLQIVRQKQKDMIKNGTAATGNTNWQVNNSIAQGRKMVKDMQKLLLRAFNSECSELIDKVKYNTFDTALKRITSSYEAISKLGKIADISITHEYYGLKIEELRLAFEYRQKQQEEKELQRELRAQMREEAKLQKEIEAERKKYEKERAHYNNALHKIELQISQAKDDELQELLKKKNVLEEQLVDIQKSLTDIDYREANQRAGYVYIISNIGSFGENVYKIGMTRRLDPMERIKELGDASVPFNFDVHAMIFSDDAPALEAALHNAFESKKVNMINQRREFFNVTLDEIKDVVRKNFDKTVEFIDLADAEQYRQSLKMKGIM